MLFKKAYVTFATMKKKSIILITALVVVISIGNFGLFSLFLNQYKTTLQAQIQNNTSSVIDIIHINPSELYANNTNISWEDDNKEIISNDFMINKVIVSVSKYKQSYNVVEKIRENNPELYKRMVLLNRDVVNSDNLSQMGFDD